MEFISSQLTYIGCHDLDQLTLNNFWINLCYKKKMD